MTVRRREQAIHALQEAREIAQAVAQEFERRQWPLDRAVSTPRTGRGGKGDPYRYGVTNACSHVPPSRVGT